MRKHINRLKTSFLLPGLLLLLAACGGGGGSSPVGGGGGAGGDDGAGTPSAINSFSLTNSEGGSVSSVSAGTSTTVSFTVVDSSGDAVPNAAGSFDLDVPIVSTKSGSSTSGASQKSVANGSFTASSSGVVSITLSITDPTVAGTGVLSIILGDTTVTQDITVVQVAGVPVSFSITLLQDEADNSSNITSISAANPGFIVADLVDFNGNPVTGEIISISSTLGTLTPASGSVLTNSTGRATADIEVGAAQPGEAGVVTVTVPNLDSQSFNFDIADSGTTSTSGFDIVVGLYDSDVDLGNLAGSNQVSAVSTVSAAFFVVTVTDTITGNPVEGAIVSVSTTVGTVTPSNGQILTNANGIAAAQIGSGTADAGSAGTLTASIEDVQASINFSIGSVDLLLGRDANGFVDPDNISFVNGEIFIEATSDLAPNGTTALQVVVVQSNDTSTGLDTPLTVDFSSLCSASGLAIIDTGITTVNGIASATYEANGCEGTDDITATVQELSGITATGSLNVADAAANSIQFISADPTTIALQGTGGAGRQEFSTLTFRVIDEAGSPISGQVVSVSLSTTLGGVSLTGDTNSDGDLDVADGEALTSNSNGEVNVIVNAGTVPTSVRVEASITLLSGSTINTVSDNLVVSTGLPDNNSFSISSSLLAPGGFEFDGFESTLTVRAADAFNNPVPDGTTINFTTEYGRIVDTCTTVNGDCSAIWNSQSPRTPDLSSTGNVLTVNNTRCDSNHDGTADVDSAAVTVPFGVPCPVLNASDSNVLALTGNGFTSVLVDATDQTFPGQVFGGRTTIMAYAIGEESFIDANGNGVYDWIDADSDGEYDTGETLEAFIDLSETFVDHNEDGVFGNAFTPGGCTAVGAGTSIQSVVDVNDIDNDGNTTETIGAAELCSAWQVGGAEEEFIDFDVDGVYDRGNGIYNGTLCSPVLAALTTPLCTTQLVSVRDEKTLIAGGETPFLALYNTSNVLLAAGATAVDVSVLNSTATRRLIISDRFNGRLPSGTTVTVTSNNCAVDSLASIEFTDTSAFGNHVVDISVSEDSSTDGNFGTVTATVTVPESAGGIFDTISFNCTDLD